MQEHRVLSGEMGLGKTMQAVAATQISSPGVFGVPRVLVVCPTSTRSPPGRRNQ
jgi:SNF2 family DNA or RNA helicase